MDRAISVLIVLILTQSLSWPSCYVAADFDTDELSATLNSPKSTSAFVTILGLWFLEKRIENTNDIFSV